MTNLKWVQMHKLSDIIIDTLEKYTLEMCTSNDTDRIADAVMQKHALIWLLSERIDQKNVQFSEDTDSEDGRSDLPF